MDNYDPLCIKDDVCDIAICDGAIDCKHSVLKSSIRTKTNFLEITELIEKIDSRFKSGNQHPVERTHITAIEWKTIRTLIDQNNC